MAAIMISVDIPVIDLLSLNYHLFFLECFRFADGGSFLTETVEGNAQEFVLKYSYFVLGEGFFFVSLFVELCDGFLDLIINASD